MNISEVMGSTNVRSYMFGKDNIGQITSTLSNGGIILYPTDTIWGIGCDATNPVAVERVFKLKNRPPAKSFVLLVDSIEMLKEYVNHVHPRVDTLLHYHVRPLTVIYDQARNLPQNVIANDGSVGIRIVQDVFCRELIRSFGKPLVATSANISNEPSPTCFGNVSSEVIQGVDYVARHRQNDTSQGEPSVIIKVDNEGEIEFLRK